MQEIIIIKKVVYERYLLLSNLANLTKPRRNATGNAYVRCIMHCHSKWLMYYILWRGVSCVAYPWRGQCESLIVG